MWPETEPKHGAPARGDGGRSISEGRNDGEARLSTRRTTNMLEPHEHASNIKPRAETADRATDDRNSEKLTSVARTGGSKEKATKKNARSQSRPLTHCRAPSQAGVLTFLRAPAQPSSKKCCSITIHQDCCTFKRVPPHAA
jgi:hypothetical protein